MNLDKSLQKILENEELTKEEKSAKIKNYFRKKSIFLNMKLWLYLAKIWLGELFVLLSSVIPATGVGKAGYAAMQGRLVPHIGRKIAGSISTGITSGAAMGVTYGVGDSMLNDKNLASTVLTDTLLFSLYGGVLGGTTSYIERYLLGKKLKSYGDIDKLSKALRTEYRSRAKKFYRDFVQGRYVYKDGIYIYFNREVAGEQNTHNPKLSKYFPELIDDLIHSERIPNAKNVKTSTKPHVSHYRVYKGSRGHHYIEVLKPKKNNYDKEINNNHKQVLNYYIQKDTFNGEPQETIPGVKEDVSSPIKDNRITIINDSSEKVNPLGGNNRILEGRIEINEKMKGTDALTGYAAEYVEFEPLPEFNEEEKSGTVHLPYEEKTSL